MNSLKLLTRNTFRRNNGFYSFISKNKYRRDIQPGYTRYNWDSLNYEKISI